MLYPISSSEKTFIEKGCQEDIRYDGRSSMDYRNISIENNILPHLNGSSRVKIMDSIDIICSVKVIYHRYNCGY